MRMSNPLKQNVNFYISVAFIASFALFVTVMGAKAVNLSLPLMDNASASVVAY